MVLFVMILIIVVGCVMAASSSEISENNLQTPNEESGKLDLLVNKSFEENLRKKIADSKYREQILELIQEDLEYVYGEVWKDLFQKKWGMPASFAPAFSSVENIVAALLLSKSGLIPDYYRWGGVQISNFDVANAYECLKILQCIEKNIQTKRCSKEFSLTFLPDITFLQKRATVHYDKPCSGEFYWGFQKVPRSATYKINNIHNKTLVQACIQCSIGERSLHNVSYGDNLLV